MKYIAFLTMAVNPEYFIKLWDSYLLKMVLRIRVFFFQKNVFVYLEGGY